MEGWKDTFGEQYTEDQIKALYEEIKLPKRATAGSAGYDFYAPDDFVIEPGKTIKIPTGIRVEMEENWVLKCYPVKRRHHFPVTVKWNLIFSWITFSYFCSFHSIAASQIDQRCLCRISDFHSIFIGRIVT